MSLHHYTSLRHSLAYQRYRVQLGRPLTDRKENFEETSTVPPAETHRPFVIETCAGDFGEDAYRLAEFYPDRLLDHL